MIKCVYKRYWKTRGKKDTRNAIAVDGWKYTNEQLMCNYGSEINVDKF